MDLSALGGLGPEACGDLTNGHAEVLEAFVHVLVVTAADAAKDRDLDSSKHRCTPNSTSCV